LGNNNNLNFSNNDGINSSQFSHLSPIQDLYGIPDINRARSSSKYRGKRVSFKGDSASQELSGFTGQGLPVNFNSSYDRVMSPAEQRRFQNDLQRSLATQDSVFLSRNEVIKFANIRPGSHNSFVPFRRLGTNKLQSPSIFKKKNGKKNPWLQTDNVLDTQPIKFPKIRRKGETPAEA
jgi:hypothetical protein